jgi:predicted nucleic acid-binding protein
LRFKRSIHNAVRNFAEKARTYRRFIRQELPAAVTADDLVAQRAPEGDHETIEGFREMVRRHLGPQALTVLDARMQGQEMKDLPISPYNIKKLVQGIKDLARRYAVAVADPALLAQIERMMATEERTVARRQATLRQRAGVAG